MDSSLCALWGVRAGEALCSSLKCRSPPLCCTAAPATKPRPRPASRCPFSQVTDGVHRSLKSRYWGDAGKQVTGVRESWDQGHASVRLRQGCPRGGQISPIWAWRWWVSAAPPMASASLGRKPRSLQLNSKVTEGAGRAGEQSPWVRLGGQYGGGPGLCLTPKRASTCLQGPPCFWPARTDGGRAARGLMLHTLRAWGCWGARAATPRAASPPPGFVQ